MAILYLIFGHLVADFVLQPNELVKWKFRSWHGTFFHSVIHFITYLLIFFPFLPGYTVLFTLLGISTAHFLIDNIKIGREKKGRIFHYFFLIDQLFHVLTLAAGGIILAGREPHYANQGVFSQIYGNSYVVIGLCLLIFSSYAMEMFSYQYKRESNQQAAFKPNYKAMVKRAIIFTAAYGAFIILTHI